jgi:hypothetical protein
MSKNTLLKTENENLKLENENLKLEIENLKNDIAKLNENTVIESMNDMKRELESLEENSVPLNLFLSLKNNYKQYYNISVSINNINDVIIEELQQIQNCNFTEDYKSNIIDSSLHSLSLISKIINNHDEWNENECHCDYVDN